MTKNQRPQFSSLLTSQSLPTHICSVPGFAFLFLPTLKMSNSKEKQAAALGASEQQLGLS